MNLDELRSVQAKERRKDSLQHLRDAFYDDVATYIADLKAARDRKAEQVDKPFADDDVRRMSDEVETAEEVAEALYERRVGKVVKLASFEAADMPVEQEGMTTQERQLFDDLVARISENKSSVLDVLTGEVTPTDSTRDIPATGSAGGDSKSVDEVPPERTEPGVGDESNAVDERTPDESMTDPDPTGQEPPNDGTLADAMGVGERVDDPADDPADDSRLRRSDSTESSSDASPTPNDAETTEATDRTPVDPDPAPPEAIDDTTSGNGQSADIHSDDPPSTDIPSEETPTGETGPSPATVDVGMDRVTVKITRDVGDIFGVDEREYDLTSEDVVTLPEENAEPLLQRDAAERLE